MNQFEKEVTATRQRVAITDIEIEPNIVIDGEIGRSFWLETRSGRLGHQDSTAYIKLDPEAGQKADARVIEMEMTREDFMKLMNYDEAETNFSKINESLNPMREFVALHLG